MIQTSLSNRGWADLPLGTSLDHPAQSRASLANKGAEGFPLADSALWLQINPLVLE